jgi:hypothetical protein
MKSNSSWIQIILCFMAAMVSGTAVAGGGVGVGNAQESTQLKNNRELARQYAVQVQQYSEIARSYIVQYNQLVEQTKAGAKAEALPKVTTLLDVNKDLQLYVSQLEKSGQGAMQIVNAIGAFEHEAKTRNMTLQDYGNAYVNNARQGDQAAAARVERERALVDSVRVDMQLARELGAKIPQTEGVHAATQVLNTQVNLMISQLGKVISILAQANGSDKEAEKMRERQTEEMLRNRQAAVRKQELLMIQQNRTVLEDLQRSIRPNRS